MKKLLIPFLMTMVATVPFSSNALVAYSQTTYPIFDSQEEDDWIVRINEIKDTGRSNVSEEEFIELVHYFIPESDQVIVVDLREECDGMPEYWADGFHSDFNQTTVKLEQNENECLREALDTLYVRIEDGEYQINQNNLVTLQQITEGEFAESFEHRYVRFQIADDDLQNDLFMDQFLLHTLNYSDYRVRVQYLPNKESTTTLFFLLDTISREEKSDYKHQPNNYVSRQISDSNILCSKHVCQRSPFVISKPVTSNEIYDRLLCDYAVGGGAKYEWGGNEPPKGGFYLDVKASDDRGNYVHGSYERTGDRNTVSGDGGHEDRRRGRADN